MSIKTFRGRYARISDFYRDEEESMWQALSEYEDLAKAGRRYPEHRVNLLFSDLKRRFIWTYEEFWNEMWDNFDTVYKMCKTAVTRADKVATIDAIMTLEHSEGQVLSALYYIDSERSAGRDEDGERVRRIDLRREYVDHKIYNRLQELSRESRESRNRPRITPLMFQAITRDNPRRYR